MEKKLEDYTIEELRDEIKRRNKLAEANKKKELRCRNCKFMLCHSQFPHLHYCDVRTWGKTYVRHYCVKPYFQACDKFENKYE